jgi:hypothetical protein
MCLWELSKADTRIQSAAISVPPLGSRNGNKRGSDCDGAPTQNDDCSGKKQKNSSRKVINDVAAMTKTFTGTISGVLNDISKSLSTPPVTSSHHVQHGPLVDTEERKKKSRLDNAFRIMEHQQHYDQELIDKAKKIVEESIEL